MTSILPNFCLFAKTYFSLLWWWRQGFGCRFRLWLRKVRLSRNCPHFGRLRRPRGSLLPKLFERGRISAIRNHLIIFLVVNIRWLQDESHTSTAVQWIQTHRTGNSTAYSAASTQPTAWDLLLFFYYDLGILAYKRWSSKSRTLSQQF